MEEKSMLPVERFGNEVQPVDVSYVPDDMEGGGGGMGLLSVLLRRWWVAVLAALVVCAAGLPPIWFLIKPEYTAMSAINIAPVIPRIVYADEAGPVPFYSNYANTQAALIRSPQALYAALEDPRVRELPYVKALGEPADQVASLRESLSAGADRGSQLLLVSMTGEDAGAVREITNAVVRAYMRQEGDANSSSDDVVLRTLEQERDSAWEKLKRLQDQLDELGQQYGTTELSSHEEIMLQTVQALQQELTRVQTSRIALQARVEYLRGRENTASAPANLVQLRKEYVRTDPLVGALTQNIVDLEREYAIAKLKYTNEEQPELERSRQVKESLQEKLDEAQSRMGEEFEELMARQTEQERTRGMEDSEDNLKYLEAQEKHLEEALSKHTTETVKVGREGLAMEKVRRDVRFANDLYDTVRQRIQVLEVERQRPARVRVAYAAETPTHPSRDKRKKYMVVLVMGAFLFGGAMVIFLHEIRKQVSRPVDVEMCRGMKVLGTTPRDRDLRRGKVGEGRLEDDYRTIRVNLMLGGRNGSGHMIVVASPEGRDGKTTFAINLAASIAMTGQRVLLVDGDLRKPDVGRYLKLEDGLGLPDVLAGECRTEEAIRGTEIPTLEIMPSHARYYQQTELLAGDRLEGMVRELRGRYDEIVVDTPAVLVLPDAKVWARLAQSVVLVARSEKTGTRELIAAQMRIEQAGARVSGVVVTGARQRDSYGKYYDRYREGVVGEADVDRDRGGSLILKRQEKGGKEEPAEGKNGDWSAARGEERPCNGSEGEATG